MRLGVVLSRDDLANLGIPVIVESWERVVSRQFIPARIRNAYREEFSESERRWLSKMYNGRFYRWVLVTGFPKEFSCRASHLHLIKRAVNFFATI